MRRGIGLVLLALVLIGGTSSARAADGDRPLRLAAPVHLGFIEEPPSFDEVIGAGAGEIVVGLFVSAGTHALDDVAARVAAAGTVVHHVAAIGRDAGVADLVEKALADAFPTGARA